VGGFVFISKAYFSERQKFVEMLDVNNLEKQSTRFYLYINIEINGNSFYIPLRKHVDIRMGNIGYAVPSSTKPFAGLDFRKALIVNDKTYIEAPQHVNVASSQMKNILNNMPKIEKLFNQYVNGYCKAARKKRATLDRLYKFSTLHNFHEELGIVVNSKEDE